MANQKLGGVKNTTPWDLGVLVLKKCKLKTSLIYRSVCHCLETRIDVAQCRSAKDNNGSANIPGGVQFANQGYQTFRSGGLHMPNW